jgi:hypothetical protein
MSIVLEVEVHFASLAMSASPGDALNGSPEVRLYPKPHAYLYYVSNVDADRAPKDSTFLGYGCFLNSPYPFEPRGFEEFCDL